MNRLAGLIKKSIQESWEKDLLGTLLEYESHFVKHDTSTTEIESSGLIDCVADVFVSTLAAAVSTTDQIGTASPSTLKSIKYQTDTIAGYCFRQMLKGTRSIKQIAVSEAKDEFGSMVDDPLSMLSMASPSNYGLAVDVIDGTTLTALGLDGAYSLAAAAKGLKKFPDLQAYGVMAPSEVLNNFDFFEAPEKAAGKLIKSMASHLGKKASELCFVTHSFDTGKHHTMLIEEIKKRNVKVIIPSPVIVEPSYTLNCALGAPNSPDAMMGVFGLPEIVINTLLMGIIGNEYEIRFRIASSTPLSRHEEKTLDTVFNFSENEKSLLKIAKCKQNDIYGFNELVKEKKSAFVVATAITNDPYLKLNGISRKNECIHTESIICGFGGKVMKIKMKHELPNQLDYCALFGIRLADVSLVAIISDPVFFQWYEKLIQNLDKYNFEHFFRYEPYSHRSENCGLHATLFEFGTHYGGYENQLTEIHNDIKRIFKGLRYDPCRHLKIIPLELVRTKNALLIQINFNSKLIEGLKEIRSKSKFPDFFNVNKLPLYKHITIGRIIKYISKKELEKLDTVIKNFNQRNPIDMRRINFVTKLIAAQKTPFTDIIR